jgi:chemotaxis protein CheD
MQRPSFANALITEIGPGEHFVGQSGSVIKTLLGSCVAVCLYDTQTGIIGMNHFLLAADRLKRSHLLDSKAGYYGVHAMELVINSMTALGANKRRIQSKVFGGGNVVPQLVPHGGDFETIGAQNIAFALAFLERENIPVVTKDVGGEDGRIIYFDASDFSVYRSLIHHQQTQQLKKQDLHLYNNTKKQVSSTNATIKVWD